MWMLIQYSSLFLSLQPNHLPIHPPFLPPPYHFLYPILDLANLSDYSKFINPAPSDGSAAMAPRLAVAADPRQGFFGGWGGWGGGDRWGGRHHRGDAAGAVASPAASSFLIFLSYFDFVIFLYIIFWFWLYHVVIIQHNLEDTKMKTI